MSPLKRLFGSRNKQPSLDEQIKALEDRPESELLALVQSDTQEALREAALNHLSYNQTLLNLSLGDGNGRLQQAARKRIGQLLEEEHLSLEELSKAVSDEAQLLALSSYSSRAGQAVLEQINEPELLLELAINGASIQIRRAAAEKITTRPELEKLHKAAQGRDKTVYKLAKQRLEAFKAEDARRAEAEAQARLICDKLEQLLRSEQDPLFDAKLDKLQQDWIALPITVPEALTQRYQQALDQYRNKQTERAELQAQLVAREEAEQARQTEAHSQLAGLRNQLEELGAALYQAETERLQEDHWAEQLKAAGDTLSALDADATPARERDALERQIQQLTELLALLREHGTLAHWSAELNTPAHRTHARKMLRQLVNAARSWPDERRPAPVRDALQALQMLEQQEKAQMQAQRKHIREVEGLVRQGLGAAQRGQVRRARGLHRASQEKRAALEHIPAHLASKLEELDQAIERLSDWHEFAVTPKKEALIRSMQALEHSTMNPEELARKIHHLQDDWREVSKGVPHHDEDLWHQFQEASHRAFEPCKEFFEAQAREREANQAKREELIEQVQLYLNGYHWDTPVWKEVEHTLKQARREWRDAWPVPRQAVKSQEERFEPLMDQLHAKLSEAYDAHRAEKEQLVQRAEQLREQSELHQAIEGAKNLQAQWKQVGQCRPREDQALWKQFREHCDAIFARRQAEFDAADEARLAQANEAEAVISELKALHHQPLDNPAAQRTRIDDLKRQYQALSDLPRQRVQALNDAFYQTLKALDEQHKAARRQAKARQEQQLLNAAEAVRALELASLEGGDTTAAEEEASIALEAVEQWPGDSQHILKQRLARVASLTPEVQTQNLEALRLLCIRKDIATGQASPDADKARRMAYQMEQLQQGLGQPTDTPESLLLEWLALGGVPDPEYTQLLRRFHAL